MSSIAIKSIPLPLVILPLVLTLYYNTVTKSSDVKKVMQLLVGKLLCQWVQPCHYLSTSLSTFSIHREGEASGQVLSQGPGGDGAEV
jgi:hypothetical protein